MRPIFIGGCDRSGTTMLGAMLGADEATVCLPESHFIAELAPTSTSLTGEEAARTLRAVRRHPRYRPWQGTGCRGEIEIDAEPSFAALIDALVGEYAARTGKTGATRWIDHSPDNVLVFARLRRHFPDAKLLNIVRDGRAVARSLMPLDWGPNEPRSAAAYWMMKVGAGLAVQNALPEHVLTLRYEDLVRDPATVMRRVAEFVGIPFSQGLTQPTGFVVPEYSRGIHALVSGGAVDPARIDDWKRKMSPRQIEIFEHACKDFLSYVGYAPVAGDRPRGQTRLEWLAAELVGAGRRLLIDKLRHRLRHRRLRRSFAPQA